MTVAASSISVTGDLVWPWVMWVGSSVATTPGSIRVTVVRFEPGAGTAWHRHAVGQTLHTTDGYGIVQNSGGETILLTPGVTVHTQPGEWHWHGATPDHFMAHLAINETADHTAAADGEWMKLVTDTKYAVAIEQVALDREIRGVHPGASA